MANKRLTIDIVADSDQAVRALNRIDRSANQTVGVMGRLDTAVKGAIAGFAADRVFEFAGDLIESSNSVNESINAVSRVFGEAGDSVVEFGETAATTVGLAQGEFQELATVTGALLGNVGFSAEEAAESTLVLTQRASDMASVFNTDVSQALEAINSGLKGEADPLEQFGVKLNAAAVEARALEMGLADATGAIDDNAKAQAALSLIMEQTEALAGDFAATSHEGANAARVAAAEFENLKAEIGDELQPVYLQFLETGRELAPTLAEIAGDTAQIVSELAPLIELLGNAVGVLMDFRQSLDDLSESTNSWVSGLGRAVDRLGLTSGAVGIFTDAVNDARSATGVASSGGSRNGGGATSSNTGGGGPGGNGGPPINAFDSGGVVPGPIGSPQLAVVHGGETVLPTHRRPGGYGTTVVVNVSGSVLTDRNLEDAVVRGLDMASRRGRI